MNPNVTLFLGFLGVCILLSLSPSLSQSVTSAYCQSQEEARLKRYEDCFFALVGKSFTDKYRSCLHQVFGDNRMKTALERKEFRCNFTRTLNENQTKMMKCNQAEAKKLDDTLEAMNEAAAKTYTGGLFKCDKLVSGVEGRDP